MGPKYPVVDPAPSLDTVTANFGLGEYATWFGLTAVSLPLGYAAGGFLLLLFWWGLVAFCVCVCVCVCLCGSVSVCVLSPRVRFC